MGGGKGRKGPRGLAPEERALWEKVAKTTDPLSKSGPSEGDGDAPAPAVSRVVKSLTPHEFGGMRSQTAPAPVAPKVTFTLAEAEVRPAGRSEAGLDRRTADRLRKGTREPEARIDLHGMRAERAHRACLTFLGDALARGLRMVLVITGKGRAGETGDIMRTGRGVLRESLPGWLRASPMGGSIVGIYQAHPRHGGSGAFYVYLKRRR